MAFLGDFLLCTFALSLNNVFYCEMTPFHILHHKLFAHLSFSLFNSTGVMHDCTSQTYIY